MAIWCCFPSAISSHLRSRIHGCWLGKSISGTLGLPAEGKMERLNFSLYDPVPTIAPPNHDLELQLVRLELVEKAGKSLIRSHFAKACLDHIHYMRDEYRRALPIGSQIKPAFRSWTMMDGPWNWLFITTRITPKL